jgi:hypothetical protein
MIRNISVDKHQVTVPFCIADVVPTIRKVQVTYSNALQKANFKVIIPVRYQYLLSVQYLGPYLSMFVHKNRFKN